MKKVFKITTEVQSTKTLHYIVEANSSKEAFEIVCEGEERGEGEEVEEEIKWHTESIIGEVEFIEEIED